MRTYSTKEYTVKVTLYKGVTTGERTEVYHLYDHRLNNKKVAVIYDEHLLERILYADDLQGDSY